LSTRRGSLHSTAFIIVFTEEINTSWNNLQRVISIPEEAKKPAFEIATIKVGIAQAKDTELCTPVKEDIKVKIVESICTPHIEIEPAICIPSANPLQYNIDKYCGIFCGIYCQVQCMIAINPRLDEQIRVMTQLATKVDGLSAKIDAIAAKQMNDIETIRLHLMKK